MTNALLPIVRQSLEANGITYRVFECDATLADTAAFCEHYGFSQDQSANTIMVASKTDPVKYACCVVLATTKLDVNKKICELLGVRKASFAPMDKALALTKMEYGGVTAFGVPEGVPVYVDARVMEGGEVVMGGGNRTSKVLVHPAELTKLPGVEVVDGLAKPKAD